MASTHGKVAMAAIDKIEALHIVQILMIVDTKFLDTKKHRNARLKLSRCDEQN